jgi:hypothetical protein
MKHWSDDSDRGESNYLVKICPNIILSKKNSTYIGLGLNPVFRSERMKAEGLNLGSHIVKYQENWVS